jgi:hypothetical protein
MPILDAMDDWEWPCGEVGGEENTNGKRRAASKPEPITSLPSAPATCRRQKARSWTLSLALLEHLELMVANAKCICND